MALWLRHEVFEQSADLPPPLLAALTVESVRAVTAALRAAAPPGPVAQAAWRELALAHLQWGADQADLFWDTLALLARLGRAGGAATAELQPADVGLFLMAHVVGKRQRAAPGAHALQKFNAAWPEEEEGGGEGGGEEGGGAGEGKAEGEGKADEPAAAAAAPGSPGTTSLLHGGAPRPPAISLDAATAAAAGTAAAAAAAAPSPRSHALYSRSSAEAHRLAFVRRHLGDLLALVREEESADGGDLTSAELDALAFLVAGGPTLRAHSASLAALFRRQQPAGAAGPLPAAEVLAWLERSLTVNEIAYPPPVLASPSASAPAAAAAAANSDAAAGTEGEDEEVKPPLVVSALRRATAVRTAADLPGDARARDLDIHSCHDACVFVLAPVRFVTVLGCHNCTIVLGAAAGVVSVEHCEGTRVTVACSRLRVHNSVDCVLHVFSPLRPVVAGDNRGLRFAPHNAAYPGLAEHAVAAGLAPAAGAASNRAWASATDLEDEPDAAAFAALPPADFALITPPAPGGAAPVTPAGLPYELPPEYAAGLRARETHVAALRADLAAENMPADVRQDLEAAVRAHFWEWLVSTGKIRHVADLVQYDRSMK